MNGNREVIVWTAAECIGITNENESASTPENDRQLYGARNDPQMPDASIPLVIEAL